MTCRRELLVAILLYVALDMSLPTMPGSFVFEAAGSVESTGGRPLTRVVALPAPAGDLAPPSAQLPADPARLQPVERASTPPGCLLARRRPRAACDPPPPAEEPH